MATMKKISTTSVLTIIISCLIFLNTSLAELFDCNTPNSLTLQISENENVRYYGIELLVQFDQNNVNNRAYVEYDSIFVIVNETTVFFKAYVENPNYQINSSRPERILQTLNGHTVGVSGLTDNSNNISSQQCNLRFFNDPPTSSIPGVLDHEIQRLADTCLSEKICKKIDASKSSKDRKVSSDSQNQELTLVMPSDICDGLCPSPATSSIIQSTINKIVDIALAELIAKLKEKNEGTIHVPNIDEYFSKGSGIFKLKGHFEAVDGTFRDLTTLKRTEDAILSHNGLKFSASCGFGLTVAHLHYPHYSLHLGIFKVNGEMTGNVAGMALDAKVSIDYDKVPCVATLDKLEVTEFGRMKIKVTGLGPLNSLVSKLLSWLTKKWREEIVVKLENKLRRIVTKQLSQFDCERFRP